MTIPGRMYPTLPCRDLDEAIAFYAALALDPENGELLADETSYVSGLIAET